MKNELRAKLGTNNAETGAIRLAAGDYDRMSEEYINKFRRDYREGKLADWQVRRIEQIPGWTWDDPNDHTAQVRARHEAVTSLILKLKARYLSEVKTPSGRTIVLYLLPNSRTFMVEWDKGDFEFEVYVPVSASNRIDDTFSTLIQFADTKVY
jgi:hypothetical protein